LISWLGDVSEQYKMSIEAPHLFSVSGMSEVLGRRLHGATRKTSIHLLEEFLPSDNSV
jgi:hypothetical protein